jgi:hypothetical protein
MHHFYASLLYITSMHHSVPSWVDYELFSKTEVRAAVGDEHMYMFDMDGDSVSEW